MSSCAWRQGSGGSPPHGRGKAVPSSMQHTGPGITPAWAGKSLLTIPKLTTARDHPRMGGEKCIQQLHGSHGQGSPPHGRGKVRAGELGHGPGRITPAWAGKSCAAAALLHPNLGSPPHGRGKGARHPGQGIWKGITPAWAGKRLKRSHRSGIFISGPIPFHSVLHRPAGSGGSRAGRDGSPAGQPQNAGPA